MILAQASTVLAQAATTSARGQGERSLTIALFLVFVAITLGITVWASKQTKTAAQFYAAGRAFSGLQNGIAISGDYMSAASFLGIAGLISLFGYDGFLYSVGFEVAWLVSLLLIAELLRNSGRFTMADVLSYRMKQRPVRTAASVSTISVSTFYLLAQMVGAGALVKLLLGIKGEGGAIGAIIGVGILMMIYVGVGGMKGTTWVQIVKAGLLLSGATLLSILVLAKFNFSINNLFDSARHLWFEGTSKAAVATAKAAEAAKAAGQTPAPVVPMPKNAAQFLQPGNSGVALYTSKIDLISLGLALVLGTAGLPHILMRFYTVPTAKAARSSVNWALTIIGAFYIMTTFLGFGAAALLSQGDIKLANPGGNMAAPLLAEELGGGVNTFGGSLFLAFIAAVAFATILAVVAGLTLAATSSFAHDFYANVLKRGERDEAKEVRVAKLSTIVIGTVAIILGVAARNLNVAFLVGLAFAIAASANVPTILYSLFWRRFNTTGAVVAIYTGLISSLVLIAVSPSVMGAKGILGGGMGSFADWFKNTEPLVGLKNPGIISIPLGFIAGAVGTLLSHEPATAEKFDELEVRALTGLGAE